MTIRELIENGTITLDTVVLGTLPMTADGCIIGHGAELFYRNRRDEIVSLPVFPQLRISGGDNECDWDEWAYSTREAAEAARKEPQ